LPEDSIVRDLLAMYDELRAGAEPFDPRTSRREFRLLLTDVGTIHFLPAILRRLGEEAEGIRLLAVPMDSRQLETKLESGEADIAVGVFPHASRGLRRQRLYMSA
jgi:DNA-binding transcriptional LysR family regulator